MTTGTRLPLTDAVAAARTGDLWLFRGTAAPDQLVHAATRSPVNHVGLVLALDDLPALLWHSELGQGLEDRWSGTHHRGAQLHDLAEAATRWKSRYQQDAWIRPLDALVTPAMEEALLIEIATVNGRPFPRGARMAWRWLRGRARSKAPPSAVYCAELVAQGYAAMGLLDSRRPANWYDPGRFWSEAQLELQGEARLGDEIPVDIA